MRGRAVQVGMGVPSADTTGRLHQGKSSGASWQANAVPTRLANVAYAPLPYLTHPVDTVTGRQGWGPFAGPWQPVQFIDPAQNISTGYSGSNTWRYGPGYGNVTLFDDHSLSSVDNASLWTAIRDALGYAQRGSSSTISQSPYIAASSNRLRSLLGLEGR